MLAAQVALHRLALALPETPPYFKEFLQQAAVVAALHPQTVALVAGATMVRLNQFHQPPDTETYPQQLHLKEIMVAVD